MKLTKELVRDLFSYDPDTGILTNKKNRQRARMGDVAGCIDSGGYLRITINYKAYSCHRISFLHYYGYLPSTVDHEDTNRINNRILNLRGCTRQQNGFNSKIGKNNKSGVKGVCWHKKNNNWRTFINVDGKQKHLGSFKNVEDAKKVVEAARIKYHGEFANNG